MHSINQRVCKRDTTKPPKAVQKPKSTRDKVNDSARVPACSARVPDSILMAAGLLCLCKQAQEYAKRVPKPKVHRRPEPIAQPVDDDLLVDGELGAEAELSALEELEIKHNAARKEVEAIRNEMTKRGLK